MRRQRSVSFYADTQEEYMEELKNKKSISERRRCRSNSYQLNNSNNKDISKNFEYLQKKKFFQSYDDLEIEQLGVNSTYQLAKIENQDIEDNEGGLIQKIKNINQLFKQNNNNSFFSNLTPFSKNIIGKIGYKKNKKNEKVYKRHRSNPYNYININNINNELANNINNEQENKDEKDSDEKDSDEKNFISGIGHRSYQMRYLGLKNPHEDSVIEKRERINSIIENSDKNEETSFMDNLNINELSNTQMKGNENYQSSDSDINIKENSEIVYYDNPNEENEEIELKKENSLNSYENSGDEFELKSEKSFENSSKKDDKSNRKYTFDIKAFIPNSGDNKDEGNKDSDQLKALQNFISNNEFLSKNIDYVDEHLKFLISGTDALSKKIFLNQLLNTKINHEEHTSESINITKKVIKLLGDYIKLELYEENCNLCYSHMLLTYVDFSDGIILIINSENTSSAKYIYDVIDKLKYKINKDRRHFSTILMCFHIIKEDKKEIQNILDLKEINHDIYDILNKIYEDFEISPNYINIDLNNHKFKNEKFKFIINKFLSLSYLKKERKRMPKDTKKTHKRGMTGL